MTRISRRASCLFWKKNNVISDSFDFLFFIFRSFGFDVQGTAPRACQVLPDGTNMTSVKTNQKEPSTKQRKQGKSNIKERTGERREAEGSYISRISEHRAGGDIGGQ